jgi:hypothetical protein
VTFAILVRVRERRREEQIEDEIVTTDRVGGVPRDASVYPVTDSETGLRSARNPYSA